MTSSARKLLIMTDDLGGGTGNHLLWLTPYFERSSWDVRVLSAAPPSSRVVSDVSVDVIPRLRGVAMYPIGQVRRFNWVARYLGDYSPDLVHCYFFWSILYGRMLKRLGKIGRLVENREDQGFNWGKHEYLLLSIGKSAPDRVVAVSEAVRSTVVEKEKLDVARTTVIRNGIQIPSRILDRDASLLSELGLKTDQPVVGMVANLNRAVKGVRYFIDAIPLILQDVPRAHFVVLGRGPDAGPLRDRARELGVDHRVTFAGFRRDIERFYSILDVSVLTSLTEGLSITLLESMSWRLPVVATRVGGNPEVVVDGETGYLVPPADLAVFADRVTKLLIDPDLRARMGAAGRQRVESEFRLERVAEQYLRLYEGILPGSK